MAIESGMVFAYQMPLLSKSGVAPARHRHAAMAGVMADWLMSWPRNASRHQTLRMVWPATARPASARRNEGLDNACSDAEEKMRHLPLHFRNRRV